jgi:hypothetical protein
LVNDNDVAFYFVVKTIIVLGNNIIQKYIYIYIHNADIRLEVEIPSILIVITAFSSFSYLLLLFYFRLVVYKHRTKVKRIILSSNTIQLRSLTNRSDKILSL